jgi:hypothetical protein
MTGFLRVLEVWPNRIWWLFSGAFALVMVLVFPWIRGHYPEASFMMHLGMALFYAVQVTMVQLDVVDKFGQAPVGPPAIVLFFAILLPFLGSVGLIKLFFFERLRPALFSWKARRLQGHTVVVGAGRTGMLLANAHLIKAAHHKDSSNEWVCIVERLGYNDDYRDVFKSPLGKHLVWLKGGDLSQGILGWSRIGIPKRIYLSAGADDTNLRILDQLLSEHDALPTAQRLHPCEILIHLTDVAQRTVLESLLVNFRKRSPSASGLWVRTFNVEQLAARGAFQRYWPLECVGPTAARIVLIGDAPFATELLDQLVRLGHADPSVKSRVHWIVPIGSLVPETEVALNCGLQAKTHLPSSLAPCIELTIHYTAFSAFAKADFQHVALRLGESSQDGGLSTLAHRVFVCDRTSGSNLWIAQQLQRELACCDNLESQHPTRCQIVISIAKETMAGAPALLSNQSYLLNQYGPNNGTNVLFDILKAGCHAIVQDRIADMTAMVSKRAFDMKYSGNPDTRQSLSDLLKLRLTHPDFEQALGSCLGSAAKQPLSDFLNNYWSRYDDEERWSNRDNVDHLLIKVAFVAAHANASNDPSFEEAIGPVLARVPELSAPILDATLLVNTSLQRWSAQEFDALMDRLAIHLGRYSALPHGLALDRIEHQRWAAFKLAYGWQPGARNDLAKRNNLLVDFDELNEHEKGKDALFVGLIPTLLRVAWFYRPGWQLGRHG